MAEFWNSVSILGPKIRKYQFLVRYFLRFLFYINFYLLHFNIVLYRIESQEKGTKNLTIFGMHIKWEDLLFE